MTRAHEPGQVNVRVPSPLAELTYASEEDWRKAQELKRQGEVARRRSYYEGSQFATANAACLSELAADQARPGEKALARWIEASRLPEEDRLHSYSTQIAEAVDFLTHRLAADFAVEAKGEGIQRVIDQCLDSSPELSGTADDDELSVGNVTSEALAVGDTPVRVRFDPAAGSCWLEFYPSDAVRLDFTDPKSDRPTYVALWETHWLPGDDGRVRQVTIRREWQILVFAYPGPADEPGQAPSGPVTLQCVETWWEERPGNSDGDRLIDRIPTGVPFVPWGLLRGTRRKLRAERGESIISERAMDTADRYDAVEGRSWLTCAHNAHATLVIIGDQALMQVEGKRKVHKDIADVLVFPGGTGVHAVSLPTDPSMIEHQRSVLLDELYGCFGLVRLDPTSVEGLGAISGYALELLGEKSQATFEALRTQFVRDWKALLNTVLDAHAHWSAAGAEIDPESVYDPVRAILAGLAADPKAVYPNRAMEIRTGSGRVVDAARLRDDYVSGIWPLREVWRQLGKTDDEITELEREMETEANQRQARESAGLGGIEAGRFGAPAPPFPPVGGVSSSTPIGTVGGATNNIGDGLGRR
jgi:hypothetical protein